jgi:hypothetical protein
MSIHARLGGKGEGQETGDCNEDPHDNSFQFINQKLTPRRAARCDGHHIPNGKIWGGQEEGPIVLQ